MKLQQGESRIRISCVVLASEHIKFSGIGKVNADIIGQGIPSRKQGATVIL